MIKRSTEIIGLTLYDHKFIVGTTEMETTAHSAASIFSMNLNIPSRIKIQFTSLLGKQFMAIKKRGV